jgi:hypothetical protein
MFLVEYLFRNPILIMMRETLLDLSLSDKGKWEIKFFSDLLNSGIIIIPSLDLPPGSEKSLDLCSFILSATDMFILFHKKRVIGNSLFFEPITSQ